MFKNRKWTVLMMGMLAALTVAMVFPTMALAAGGQPPGRGMGSSLGSGAGNTIGLPPVTGELDEASQAALVEAINEEYGALATYEAIMDQFGAVQPFVSIARSEASHVTALTTLFERYELDVPAAPECQKHTTQLLQRPVKLVTVTHPFHPFRGRQFQVVRIRQGPDPDIVVQYPDGSHAAIAMSSTDYAAPPDPESPSTPPHLLDFEGLCQAAQLIDHIRREGRYPTADDGDQPCTTGSEGYD